MADRRVAAVAALLVSLFAAASAHALPLFARQTGQQCATCHGLPNEPKSAVAKGMFPAPPELFKGTGVTDDEEWESYWKVENGIRLTGMPGFKGQLTEKQIWQATVLVKNADKIPESVKKELAAGASTPMEMAMPENPPAKTKKK